MATPAATYVSLECHPLGMVSRELAGRSDEGDGVS